MNRLTFSLAILLTAFSLQPAAAQDHQTAFKQLSGFMEGSWTPADQDNHMGPIRHVYSPTLDGKFIRTNGLQDPGRSWDGFFGMDPKSGKLAWWGFFSDGKAGPVYLTEARDMEWKFVGEQLGLDGETTRHVTIRKIGDAKLFAEVTDIADGNSTTVDRGEWVRAETGQLPAGVAKRHPWKFLVGDWEFTNSKGIKASVRFEMVAGGRASVSHWVTDEGGTAIETVGWNPDKQALVVDGYGASGNYWHVEYNEVGAEKCSGPSKVVYPNGSSVEGIMTIQWVSDDLVKLHVDGKDENGQPIEVQSQWKRVAQ